MKHLAPSLAAAALLGLAGCEMTPDEIGGIPAVPDRPGIENVTPPDHALPPISGGTLTLTPDGATAVVGDPERDLIYIVDLDPREIRAILPARGEPGRVVVDAAGQRAWIALRRAGGIIEIDVQQGTIARQYQTCPAPRGIALSMDEQQLHVACVGGHLMTHAVAGGDIVRRLPVAPDLRDVLVFRDRIEVSRFRAAELITLSLDGQIVRRRQPANVRGTAPANVAWRIVKTPEGGTAMLHQIASTAMIRVDAPGDPDAPPGDREPPGDQEPPDVPPGDREPPGRGDETPPHGAYGGDINDPCRAAIAAVAVTEFRPFDEAPTPRTAGQAVLGVDLAIDAGSILIAAPGSVDRDGTGDFLPLARFDRAPNRLGCLLTGQESPQGAFTAVAIRPDGRAVAFQREPAALVDQRGEVLVMLPVESTADAGHDLFHQAPGVGLACASCHPEGSEDGHTWLFEGFGFRRTQELRGGIAGSAPFHWQQDMADMQQLLDEVMHGRMGGAPVAVFETDALTGWLDALPAPSVDPIGEGDPIAGQLVFEDPTVGCAGCHAGPRYSDGRRYDVGAGEPLETATLIGIGRRAKLMHDGCADTLEGRFDPSCGGRDHGRVNHLSTAQMSNLLAFLRTL